MEPPADHSPAPGLGLVAAPLFAFVVLGFPDGMLGVAWPALRHDFGQPLASLGLLLLVSLLGYLGVTSITGAALRRFGAASLLTVSAVTATAGAALIVIAPWWPVLIGAVMLLGAANGGLDAALNTAVALTRPARFINLLHAAFGVGAALGPLAVTASLASTHSWRGAYGVLLILEVMLAGVWLSLRGTLSQLSRRTVPDGRSRLSPAKHLHGNRRLQGLLAISLGVSFCYGGLEIAVASWSASFLRGPGGSSVTMAGIAVFIFWVGLTASRIGVAGIGSRLAARNAAWSGIAGCLTGAALVWANIAPVVTMIAFVLIGLSLGPVFPAIMGLTPARIGPRRAVSAIGWQLAAAGVGGAGLSALIGVALQLTGLESLGPSLMILAVVLGGLNLLLERAAPHVGKRG